MSLFNPTEEWKHQQFAFIPLFPLLKDPVPKAPKTKVKITATEKTAGEPQLTVKLRNTGAPSDTHTDT